jgi:hypothetical protein
MDVEQIKRELTDRVTKVSNERTKDMANLSGLSKLTEIKDRLQGTPNFTEEIVKLLNDILKEKNINFPTNIDKEKFIADLKPTILTLTKNFIIDK